MAARLFTSESVTEGHPDKICDQISDAILDEMLRQDAHSRVAVETMVTTGLVHVAGEVTTTSYVEIPKVVRETVLRIGYDSSTKGFDGRSCGVSVSIGQQSPDIAQGVDTAYESRTGAVDPLDKQGAGDQGLMFGYACDDTAELMPLPIHLAHRLSERLTRVRKNQDLAYLRPDGKTQVTIEYDGDRPVRLDTVVISSQHAADVSLEGLLQPDVIRHVIDPVLEELQDSGSSLDISDYRTLINPTGRFEIGGPMGDAGLTGRKIIVDTYGGIRHQVGRQERRRGWPGSAVRGSGGLCDRRCQAGGPLCRNLRHRDRASRKDPGGDHGRLRPAARRDRRGPRPVASDLRSDRGIRALWAHLGPGCRGLLHMGAPRPGRSAASRHPLTVDSRCGPRAGSGRLRAPRHIAL